MDFTNEQQNAIHIHDQNLIVVAGAGSGKTRVLVERYLALLDAHPEWSLGALVAITFTKKAAEEMRDRVRKALESRRHTAATPVETARWTTLLTQIDGARINTIHGLCANILRANAAEAQIDPGFGVIEEFDALILREDVVDAVLNDLAETGGDELELFTEYSQNDVRNVLSNPMLLSAGIAQTPDNLMMQWQIMWELNAREVVGQFLREIQAIGTVVPPEDDDKLGDMWKICNSALDSMVGTDSEGLLIALTAITKVKLNVGSAKNWGDKETLVEAKAALKTIRTAAQTTLRTIGDPPAELDARAADLLPLWASLIQKTHTAYQHAKARLSLLDFDDLEQMTCDLLQHHPQVSQRYRGAEFQHLLVDEFQDTNASQWQIVQALADLQSPGSLFVVGDPKQSIYAFRGADVSVFEQVKQEITGTGGDERPLSASFRTHQPLVDCFNRLFGRLLRRDLTSPAVEYQVELGTAMTAFRTNPPQENTPAIEICLVHQVEHDDDGQPICGDDGKPLKLKTDDRRQWEAQEIAQRLQKMVESKTLIFDRETRAARPIRYDDIAILFQSLSAVTLYEDVFKMMGLPYVTVAGRGYYGRQEVWDLLNLLQAVYNPADDLSVATALRSPLFNLSDETLLVLRLPDVEGKMVSLWEAINNHPDTAFAHQTLDHLHSIAGRVTISELLREAVDRTGYLAILTGLPDGDRRRGNVEKLLSIAQTTGRATLGEFSQYLRDLSTREAHEGEAPVDVSGVVRVMTVHASKGLEFPVVVLADASWERKRQNMDLVVLGSNGDGSTLACKVYNPEEDKMTQPFCYRHAVDIQQLRDEAERLRLLYVAMTRAQDNLLITGQAETNKEGEWKTSGWLAHLLDHLDLFDHLAPGQTDSFDYAGHNHILRLHLPKRRAEIISKTLAIKTGWDRIKTGTAWMPPLLQGVLFRPSEQARHLAATHIADLGSAGQAPLPEQAFYRERFRRQVFHDAPSHIETVSVKTNREKGVSARQIGEIVHQALQHWHLPGDDDEKLLAMLDSYAWRQGITHTILRENAVQQAYKLLQRFISSDVYNWLRSAQQVYRELPFIYELDGHVIHGIIDLLFQAKDGRWLVMDYKTSAVQKPSNEALNRHAQRYHLQMGVYAAAVREQLGGAIPETYIHYVRYTKTVKIAADDWQTALAQKIPDRINQVFDE